MALLFAYAIWFAYFVSGFSAGNMTWSFCLAFGIQFLLGAVYAFLLYKKPVPAAFGWGALLFWAAGSAFLPYYNLTYFFNLNIPRKELLPETMKFLLTQPSIGQIVANSTQVVPNSIVHAAAALLMGIGLWAGTKKPARSL